jgi:hypothetical protein
MRAALEGFLECVHKKNFKKNFADSLSPKLDTLAPSFRGQ